MYLFDDQDMIETIYDDIDLDKHRI
jgi:hypothetical protein